MQGAQGDLRSGQTRYRCVSGNGCEREKRRRCGIPFKSYAKSRRMGPSPLRCLFVTPTGKKQRQLQRFIRALRMTAQQRRVLSVISNRQDLADCTGRAAQSSQGLPNFISSFSSFGLPLKSLVVAILKGWQSRLYDYFQAVIGLEKSVPSTLSQHGLDSAANLSVSISRSVLIDCSDYRIRLYLEVSELKKKV